jgi:hypothetical protein
MCYRRVGRDPFILDTNNAYRHLYYPLIGVILGKLTAACYSV